MQFLSVSCENLGIGSSESLDNRGLNVRQKRGFDENNGCLLQHRLGGDKKLNFPLVLEDTPYCGSSLESLDRHGSYRENSGMPIHDGECSPLRDSDEERYTPSPRLRDLFVSSDSEYISCESCENLTGIGSRVIHTCSRTRLDFDIDRDFYVNKHVHLDFDQTGGFRFLV
jgi:hypothetical protein